MKHIIPLILASLVASACATTSANQLPVCDGKHLRPANPNGSVLDPAAQAAPATSRAAPTQPAPAAAQPGCGA
jgi:type IV secretion system protein VirB7